LADKARNQEQEEIKRKAQAAQLETEASQKLKRIKSDHEGKKQWILDQKARALTRWCEDMNKGTDDLYKDMHGDEWRQIRDLRLKQLALEQEEAHNKQQEATLFREERNAARDVRITGFKWV
jgi:chromatin structure-remodeling complex subunit RSC1/2